MVIAFRRKVVKDTGFSSSAGEFEWCGAYNTYFWVDPTEQLVGILMTQFVPSFSYSTLNREFKILVYQAIVN